MSEARIGRVLVASLHEAVGELLPSRLEFYETWLRPSSFGGQRLSQAPLSAALSFLRREGEVYGAVTTRAGAYAAEWTFAMRSAPRRALMRILPASWRARWALRAACTIIRATFVDTRVVSSLRAGKGSVVVRGSVFCEPRERVAEPLCWFHASSLQRMLELARVDARVAIEACRARGDENCRLAFTVARRRVERSARGRTLDDLGAGDARPSEP